MPTSLHIRPTTKVALITGAAGILGPEICLKLRREGWHVAATDRLAADFDIAESILGEKKFWDFRWLGDLSSKSACGDCVHATEEVLGPISLLVNNAAYSYREKTLWELEEARAVELFQINTLAPLWLAAAALPSLTLNRGTVINISSAQTQGWLANNHLYIASKAALEKLTETLSADFADIGARCIGLRLGSFPGVRFLRDYLQQLPEEAIGSMVAEILPLHLERTADLLGENCVGSAAELAEFLLLLTSPHARMLNGCILSVDGGMTVRPIAWPSQTESYQQARQWFENWKQQHHNASDKN